MSNEFKLRKCKVYDKVTGKRVGTIVGLDGLNDLYPDDFWVRVLFDAPSYVMEDKLPVVKFCQKYTTKKPEVTTLQNLEYDIQIPESLLEAAANDSVETLRNVARKQADKLLNPKIEKRGRLDTLQEIIWDTKSEFQITAIKGGRSCDLFMNGSYYGTYEDVRQMIDCIIK
jgi:hypothetical protein